MAGHGRCDRVGVMLVAESHHRVVDTKEMMLQSCGRKAVAKSTSSVSWMRENELN